MCGGGRFCSEKTKLGERRGGGNGEKEGRKGRVGEEDRLRRVGEGKAGGGDLPFQPVSAQWLATCLCRWLRGDL